MADNFKTLEQTIDDKITNAGGAGSILAADHNAILKEFIQKSGKYTGAPFKARRTPNNGVIPTGTLFFNNNALNNENDFVITTAKNTADLNDFGLILDKMSEGDLLHFKDYAGRSVFFIYKSHVAGKDTVDGDKYDITVAAVPGNTNYSYSATDDEISVTEAIIGGNASASPITIDGVVYRYKNNSASGTAAAPEQYDVAEYGIREVTEDATTFNVVQTLMYNSGTPGDIASWETLMETEISF